MDVLGTPREEAAREAARNRRESTACEALHQALCEHVGGKAAQLMIAAWAANVCKAAPATSDEAEARMMGGADVLRAILRQSDEPIGDGETPRSISLTNAAEREIMED